MSSLPPLSKYIHVIKEKKDLPLPIYSVTLSNGMQPRDTLGRSVLSELESKDNLFAAKGDICYNMMRMWQGASGLVPEDCHVSPAYVVCRPKDNLDPTYASYMLKSQEAIKAFIDRSQGVTSDRWRLYPDEFLKVSLFIPPLPEQKKIAEILSGIDKRREVTTKKAANILRLQNALREKIFSSLHGERVPLGEICNPKQWQTISTTQLTASGYPVYGANGMIGYFSEFNHKDPVLAVTCRGATCGNLTLVPEFSYVTGNSMCLDNPRSDTSPEYLFHFLSWRGLKDVISGSAQPQITRSPLQAVEVVLPSVEKQDKIVSALESVSNMEHSIKTMLDRLDLLKQALSSDLLSGRKRVSV